MMQLFFICQQRVAFSKNKSDIVAKKDGTFVPREKRSHEKMELESSSKEPRDINESSSIPTKQAKLVVNTVPHNILFAQQLPEACTQEILVALFQQYPGYKEIRMVPGKREIAFIEFIDHIHAGVALQQLNGFKIFGPSSPEVLHLTYGKQ